MTEEQIQDFVQRLLGGDHAESVRARREALSLDDVLRIRAMLDLEDMVWFIRLVKTMPDEAVSELASDSREPIRVEVACKSALRRLQPVVENLASDSSFSVREALARNRRVPVHWLEKLAVDPEPHIREWLEERGGRIVGYGKNE